MKDDDGVFKIHLLFQLVVVIIILMFKMSLSFDVHLTLKHVFRVKTEIYSEKNNFHPCLLHLLSLSL